jgi:acetyl esterase/lipase
MTQPLIAARSLAWAGVLSATVWVGWEQSGPGVRPLERAASAVKRDIPYRVQDGRRLKLDIYLPRPDDRPPDGRSPAVLLVHGGSWIGGSKSSYRSDRWRNPTRLIEAGMVVVAVDYRLGRPKRPNWPEALDDLRESVRWVRRHAAEYRIDPDRIAVLGQSAGAHLAMLLGTDGEPPAADGVSSKVQAVISFYGPTDLASLVQFRRSRRDPVLSLLGRGASPGDFSAREDEASPVARVSRSAAPMLLLHGTEDRWVPLDQAREMAEALERAGVFHRLEIVEGARHGFETIVASPKRTDLMPTILAFLARVWNASSAHHPTLHRASTDVPHPISPPHGP